VRVHGVVIGTASNICILSFDVVKAAPVLELVPAAAVVEAGTEAMQPGAKRAKR
jgi:hypothetical protein